MRVTVIVNPAAGRALHYPRLEQDLQGVARDLGVCLAVQQTTSAPDCCAELARAAVRDSDLVLACGGDGTVHGVVQGIARSQVPLGVLPLGTANALARNLALPLDPVLAFRRLLSWTPVAVPLGCAETGQSRRWFLVMAGAGPDAELVHATGAAAKAHLGRSAYYLHAARLLLTRRFPRFTVEYRRPGSSCWQAQEATALLTSRVTNLGGLFRGLNPPCDLRQPWLQVQMLRAPSALSLPAWFVLRGANPWVQTLAVEEARCFHTAGQGSVRAQADAEPLGPLPLRLWVQANALRLLMPPR